MRWYHGSGNQCKGGFETSGVSTFRISPCLSTQTWPRLSSMHTWSETWYHPQPQWSVQWQHVAMIHDDSWWFMKSTLSNQFHFLMWQCQGHVGIHDTMTYRYLDLLGSTWYIRMLGTSVVAFGCLWLALTLQWHRVAQESTEIDRHSGVGVGGCCTESYGDRWR